MVRIAVDLDDVLTDSVQRLINYSNREWGHNLTPADYSEDWVQMWNVDESEATRRSKQWHETVDYHAGNPDPDSIRVLRRLAEHHQLAIVTSRRLWVKDQTVEWVEKYYPGIFESVNFAGMWEDPTIDSVAATKAEAVAAVGADYLIDDQPKHCFGVVEAGNRAIMFGDYHWNRDHSHDEIVRCSDWRAVGEYFERYS